jgi:ribosomal protein S18 acetylase RimI-like enzyme
MTQVPRGLEIRPYETALDETWAAEILGGELAGRWQARRDVLVDVLDAEGLVAEAEGERVGVLAFRPDGAEAFELAALVVTKPGHGIGSALIAAFLGEASRRGARRVWVVTTNDNLDALRLYQRRGFRIAEVRVRAIDRSRTELKPSIGAIGANGIPIRDEIELAIDL